VADPFYCGERERECTGGALSSATAFPVFNAKNSTQRTVRAFGLGDPWCAWSGRVVVAESRPALRASPACRGWRHLDLGDRGLAERSTNRTPSRISPSSDSPRSVAAGILPQHRGAGFSLSLDKYRVMTERFRVSHKFAHLILEESGRMSRGFVSPSDVFSSAGPRDADRTRGAAPRRSSVRSKHGHRAQARAAGVSLTLRNPTKAPCEPRSAKGRPLPFAGPSARHVQMKARASGICHRSPSLASR